MSWRSGREQYIAVPSCLRAGASVGPIAGDQLSQVLEARFPTDVSAGALLTRRKSFVPERDAGSAFECLEQ